MCFRFLQVAWWFYWTGELPHHDVAHVEGVEADAASHPADVAPGDKRAKRAAARSA